VTLFNVLPPEILRLEQLRALRHLASIPVVGLLLDILGKLLIESLIHRLTAKLAQVGIFRLQDLQKFLLESLNPVECAL
jgi:hypothetical protein